MSQTKKRTTAKTAPGKSKSAAKPNKSDSLTASADQPRKLNQKPKKKFLFFGKQAKEVSKLPGAFAILRGSLSLLWQNKGQFLGVLAIYALLQIILVQGVLGANFQEVLNVVQEALDSKTFNFEITVALFAYMLSTSGKATTADGNVYQLLLVLMASLALIWSLRQVSAKVGVRVRDAYYKGMHPIIPFVLVFAVVLAEAVPLLAGVWLYDTILSAAIAATLIEKALLALLAVLLGLLSLYMLVGGVIALYVAALPDMTPVRAIRSANALVKFRRVSVFWRILVLGVTYILILAALVLPVISFAPEFAPWVFYLATVLLLAVVHSYMYRLYRELLSDA